MNQVSRSVACCFTLVEFLRDGQRVNRHLKYSVDCRWNCLYENFNKSLKIVILQIFSDFVLWFLSPSFFLFLRFFWFCLSYPKWFKGTWIWLFNAAAVFLLFQPQNNLRGKDKQHGRQAVCLHGLGTIIASSPVCEKQCLLALCQTVSKHSLQLSQAQKVSSVFM